MKNSKPKFFIITTIPLSMMFFKGQISVLKTFFDIHLVSSPGPLLDNAARNESVKMHPLQMSREIELLKDVVSFFKILKLLFRERPDVIHCNTPKASLLFLTAGFILRIPCRIYYVHGFKYHGTKGRKRSFLVLIEKITCFFATDIIAVSKGVQKELMKEITRKKIHIIGNGSINGINLSLFDATKYDKNHIRQNEGIESRDYVFGFIGRLVGDKGLNELVAAFTKLTLQYNNVKLLIIGAGEGNLDPIKATTLDQIQNNKHIVAVGFQEDVKPFISAMDLFVFPSYREGFGLSVMEANAMGVPAITSNIMGCNEIIEEGINGFLVPSKDELALYKKMEFCLNNKNLIEKMSLQCREVMQKKYEQNSVWSNSLMLYKQLVIKHLPDTTFS